MNTPHPSRVFAATAISIVALVLTGCDAIEGGQASDAVEPLVLSSFWDSSTVHAIDVVFDQSDYDSLIETYRQSGEKVWITATVTIDGVSYENAGFKLKGNSSLRGLSEGTNANTDAECPETLPWIIRLDKFVDGQNHEGSTEFAVRGNNSETSLNEALALDLLDLAGLAAEEASAIEFTVAGSDPILRLVVENPNDAWMERELGDGYLYKAETGGDYSYRGDDPDAYDEIFDQEGGEDNLDPLVDFLEFVNLSDDEAFAAELGDWLDLEAFATYLAFQELVDNFDDIDGPGNNSYLYFDPDTSLMTVVNWDLNLAFGLGPGGEGDARPGGQARVLPEGRDGLLPGDQGVTPPDGGFPALRPDGQSVTPPDGQVAEDRLPLGGERPGGAGGGNVLSERFLADPGFEALYRSALDDLTALFYGSGFADEALASWTNTLLEGASDLVDPSVIEREAAAIAQVFPQ